MHAITYKGEFLTFDKIANFETKASYITYSFIINMIHFIILLALLPALFILLHNANSLFVSRVRATS